VNLITKQSKSSNNPIIPKKFEECFSKNYFDKEDNFPCLKFHYKNYVGIVGDASKDYGNYKWQGGRHCY